jgi:ornithine decarboxylase
MKSEMKNFMKHALKQKDRSFYHLHLDKLVANINIFKEKFPGITPHYAVKCNPNPQVLSVMALNGCSFDCASKAEMKLVEKLQSNFSTSPSIIFANPIKMKTHLKYAERCGITLMTADCTEELTKIDKYCSKADVVMRIAVDDSNSLCKFNKKYGMFPEKGNLEKWFDKFDTLKNSNLVGVSFHVGSGCSSSDAYRTAIEDARTCFDYAKTRGYKLSVLDIGGGFIQKEPLISDVSDVVKKAIKENFNSTKTHIIAEPGRFLTANIADLYVKVVGKKSENGVIKYYVNNSVYGDFNCKMFDYATFEFDVIKKNTEKFITKSENGYWMDGNQAKMTSKNSTIFGSTCDSIDVIVENVPVPEMEIGEYLRFKDMGAYTMAASSTFNGIPKPYLYYFGKDLLNLRKHGSLSEAVS